jgi:hypothetical protein
MSKLLPALHRSRIGRAAVVAALAFVTFSCTSPDRGTRHPSPTADEKYLVDAYVRVTRARERVSVSYLESDSLFAALDSTVDTTRIANTIRLLNADPDRWVVVFETIARELRPPDPPNVDEAELEDTR